MVARSELPSSRVAMFSVLITAEVVSPHDIKVRGMGGYGGF
jgi:hypothetical protein